MSHVLAIPCLILTAVIGMASIATADADEPPFTITTKRDSDKVEAEIKKGNARISVYSPVGISQADIERNGENWPSRVTLRLHLKGLENLKISNGMVSLEVAVSSHGDRQSVKLWLDDKESKALDSESPYWVEVRMVSNDGKPVKTIPLANGHFEIRLPKALLEGHPKSLSIRWIDFYR